MNLFEDYVPLVRKKRTPSKIKNSNSEISKNNVLPHTQAKLNLYKDYLGAYLSVLLRTPSVPKIYLYDIFCGNGVYDDGKPGSPVIALEIIKKSVSDLIQSGKQTKPIYLIINDKSSKRLQKARGILDNRNDGSCTIVSYNYDAEEMLQITIKKLKESNKADKTLIFIDPYGYSKIRKSIIAQLMSFNNSEILLFLPIAQMHRFSLAAQRLVNNSSFEPLRKFINEFLTNYDFKTRIDNYTKVFSFINAIKDAFTFQDKYFSCSHYIQRDVQNNFYALFFITNHIYGLEKMLEAKWRLDTVSGDGFMLKDSSKLNQMSMFGDYHKSVESEFHEKFITKSLFEFMDGKLDVSNKEIYIFILKLGYLPVRISAILKQLYGEGVIAITYSEMQKTKKISTYIGWKYFYDPPKVFYKLKQNGTIKY